MRSEPLCPKGILWKCPPEKMHAAGGGVDEKKKEDIKHIEFQLPTHWVDCDICMLHAGWKYVLSKMQR